MKRRPALPIDECLPEIERLLGQPGQNLCLQAAPGAGKTTALPLALVAPNGILDKRRAAGLPDQAVVLEPRRIAARLAATQCATWHGQKVGDHIGYRVRFESAQSPQTRLYFVTEALLLRQLINDPKLSNIGVLVLDEFHERHLASDLVLALARRLQQRERPDLNLVVMSATLDEKPLLDFLESPYIHHPGRSFAIEIEHQSYKKRDSGLEHEVNRALQKLLATANQGHILVFLPGISAIRRCQERCAGLAQSHGLQSYVLHGKMSKEAQQEVVRASDTRKIIFATNVAESSVTIPGICAVIDSGLAHIARRDPITGNNRIELSKISQASAIQRSGRAGRTQAGCAYRLYSNADFLRRLPHERPEIARLDLSATLLSLCAQGEDPRSFRWFQAPEPGQIALALERLQGLALVRDGIITPLGRCAAALPLSPQASRCVIEVARRNIQLAAKIGALLSVDEAILQELQTWRAAVDESDLHADLEAWRRAQKRSSGPATGLLKTLSLHEKSIQRALQTVQKPLAALGAGPAQELGLDSMEVQLRWAQAVAYLHTLGRFDPKHPRRVVLAFGQECKLDPASALRPGDTDKSTFVVVLNARSSVKASPLATRAAVVDEEWLLELCAEHLQTKVSCEFDEQKRQVHAFEDLKIGQLVIERQEMSRLPTPGAELLYKKSRAAGWNQFCDAQALEQLLARAAFVRHHRPDFPILDQARLDALWLELCHEHHSFAQLAKQPILDILRAQLGESMPQLDRLAPAKVTLAGGRQLRLQYEGTREPGLATRLQDFFGSSVGPTVLEGQIPVRLHLRAPNQRDVQVTTDLQGFWKLHYPGLRKTLMRRYPKHAWPEDPLKAKPPEPRRSPRRR